VATFDILLALMLSTCDTKGSVMTAKQTPWMRPCPCGLVVQAMGDGCHWPSKRITKASL